MEVEDLISRAWKSVEAAGVPDAPREAAFKEAVDILRSASGSPSRGSTRSPRTAKPAASRQGSKRQEGSGSSDSEPAALVGEDDFFANLAHESGVEDDDLRDILQLTGDGGVHVTPPTRTLGSSLAEQAKTVTVLVAGARSKGLNEKPVDAGRVRKELDRKGCYDGNNFAGKHLGRLRGFNAGSNRSEIVLTSKWVDEFVAAVDKAHGRAADSSEA